MYAALRWRCDVMQILVATLRGAVHQKQRAAAYAALLPSLLHGVSENHLSRIIKKNIWEMLGQFGAENAKTDWRGAK